MSGVADTKHFAVGASGSIFGLSGVLLVWIYAEFYKLGNQRIFLLTVFGIFLTF